MTEQRHGFWTVGPPAQGLQESLREYVRALFDIREGKDIIAPVLLVRFGYGKSNGRQLRTVYCLVAYKLSNCREWARLSTKCGGLTKGTDEVVGLHTGRRQMYGLSDRDPAVELHTRQLCAQSCVAVETKFRNGA